MSTIYCINYMSYFIWSFLINWSMGAWKNLQIDWNSGRVFNFVITAFACLRFSLLSSHNDWKYLKDLLRCSMLSTELDRKDISSFWVSPLAPLAQRAIPAKRAKGENITFLFFSVLHNSLKISIYFVGIVSVLGLIEKSSINF